MPVFNVCVTYEFAVVADDDCAAERAGEDLVKNPENKSLGQLLKEQEADG